MKNKDTKDIKEIYFKIDDELLYLDYMLVRIDFLPLLYTCIDTDKNRYLVYCIGYDDDNEAYIIAKLSNTKLYKLLKGFEPIGEAYYNLNENRVWEVTCPTSDYRDDIVIEIKSEKSLPKNNLMARDLKFKVFDSETRQYIDSLCTD